MTAADRYPSYRAPQANREIFCVPQWSSLAAKVGSQRAAVDTAKVTLAGFPLSELAREARRLLVTEAAEFTNAYADTPSNDWVERPIIVTGHQPEFVHPGVWLKNFAASQLANAVGGVAVSLVIDNDLCRSPSIRTLTGTVQEPKVVDVAFDKPQREVPFEQRILVDQDLWRSFGDRVQAALEPLVANPLIGEWWDSTVSATAPTPQIGYAIAQARHRLELDWGNRSLEMPQSHVCQTRPFRLFALHLLTRATSFLTAYNGALADYRIAHRLRNSAQPLPDLQASEGWIETPFWIWTSEHPTRRILYVQPNPAGLLLSDRDQWQATLPKSAESGSDSAVEQLAAWEQNGVKIRTRALVTTLYARLLLADTFIHGIGGAKYDQVTNDLCRRFFDLDLPPYVTLSGTLRLPIDHVATPPDRVPALKKMLRDLRYHPEHHLNALDHNAASELDRWVTLKRKWVQIPQTNSNAAERHAQINLANESLYACLQSQREACERELAATVTLTRKNHLLESREYPFCLFPRQDLQDFLLDFSSRMP